MCELNIVINIVIPQNALALALHIIIMAIGSLTHSSIFNSSCHIGYLTAILQRSGCIKSVCTYRYCITLTAIIAGRNLDTVFHSIFSNDINNATCSLRTIQYRTTATNYLDFLNHLRWNIFKVIFTILIHRHTINHNKSAFIYATNNDFTGHRTHSCTIGTLCT